MGMSPEEKKEQELVATFDVKSGKLKSVQIKDEKGLTPLTMSAHDPRVEAHVKNLWHAMIYTHEKNSCITIVVGGEQYTYCW